MTEPRNKRLRSKRAAAIFLAILIILLLGVVALVVDIGHLRAANAELKRSTEAAAHAAVTALDGTEEGLQEAEARALEMAEQNPVQGHPVLLHPGDVTFGVWDESFTPSNDPEEINAVRVWHRVEGISTFFATAAFGVNTLSTSAFSTAVKPPLQPALTADCFLPLAIPDCRFAAGEDGSTIQWVVFRMNDATIDNTAWALPGFQNPSANDIATHLEEGSCDPEALDVGVISMNTGTIAQAFRALADAIDGSDDLWDVEAWGPLPEQLEGSLVTNHGRVLQGPLPLFEAPEAYCGEPDAGGYNENGLPITGLAWGVVYDVVGPGGSPCQGPKHLCPPEQQGTGTVLVRLDFAYEHPDGTSGGGDHDAGVGYPPPPRMVE